MEKFFYTASRITLVGSIVILLMRFGIFGLPMPSNLVIKIGVLLFPLSIVALLMTTKAVNTAVTVIKWMMGITFALMSAGIAYAFIAAGSAEGDIALGTATATIITEVTVLSALFIFILLVALAIAELFPSRA